MNWTIINFSDIQAIHNWIINSDILSIYVLFQFEKERQHPSISWNTWSSPIFFLIWITYKKKNSSTQCDGTFSLTKLPATKS